MVFLGDFFWLFWCIWYFASGCVEQRVQMHYSNWLSSRLMCLYISWLFVMDVVWLNWWIELSIDRCMRVCVVVMYVLLNKYSTESLLPLIWYYIHTPTTNGISKTTKEKLDVSLSIRYTRWWWFLFLFYFPSNKRKCLEYLIRSGRSEGTREGFIRMWVHSDVHLWLNQWAAFKSIVDSKIQKYVYIWSWGYLLPLPPPPSPLLLSLRRRLMLSLCVLPIAPLATTQSKSQPTDWTSEKCMVRRQHTTQKTTHYDR